MSKTQQPFNDGLATFYKLTNVAEKGNLPEMKLIKKYTLAYEERNVGYSRYFTAQQNKIVIDMIIRCLLLDIETEFIVAVGNEQYRIKQKQKPMDIRPRVMDLTLEKIGEEYQIGDE